MTASVGVALIWGYLYHPQQGLINMTIRALGGTGQIWLTDPRVRISGHSAGALGDHRHLSLVGHGLQPGHLHRRACSRFPKDFNEAAQVDGANVWHMFWRITLPLLRPTLLFVCVLTMISSFQVFDIIQIMTSGGPQDQTARHGTWTSISAPFASRHMGWAGASSLVLFAMIFFVTFVQTRLLRTQWEY